MAQYSILSEALGAISLHSYTGATITSDLIMLPWTLCMKVHSKMHTGTIYQKAAVQSGCSEGGSTIEATTHCSCGGAPRVGSQATKSWLFIPVRNSSCSTYCNSRDNWRTPKCRVCPTIVDHSRGGNLYTDQLYKQPIEWKSLFYSLQQVAKEVDMDTSEIEEFYKEMVPVIHTYQGPMELQKNPIWDYLVSAFRVGCRRSTFVSVSFLQQLQTHKFGFAGVRQ